jgi:hypothetical protein
VSVLKITFYSIFDQVYFDCFDFYVAAPLRNEDEMGGACSTHGEMRNSCNSSVRKTEGLFGRPGSTCEDCIKMDLKKIGWEFVDWIHSCGLGRGLVAGFCEYDNELSHFHKDEEFLD